MNGFYTPLKEQVDLAVREGFIAPANASLISFVDLDEGDDEMVDWGKRGMEAIEKWEVDVSLFFFKVSFDDAGGGCCSWCVLILISVADIGIGGVSIKLEYRGREDACQVKNKVRSRLTYMGWV